MYSAIYDCVSRDEVDKLLDLRSDVHSNQIKDGLCIFVEGHFENAEDAVANIIKHNSSVIGENYISGASFVMPKNKKEGIIVYLSK
jgi:hypothetical protein